MYIKKVTRIKEKISAKELIEKLSTLPSDYHVSLCGISSASILVNPENKTVLLDESDCIEGMFEDEVEYEKALSAGEQLTLKAVKTYIACVNDSYLRDTQVFNTEEILKNDEDIVEELMDDDGNWHDFAGSMFLGIYRWDEASLNKLQDYVAAKHRLNSDVIEIIPVS